MLMRVSRSADVLQIPRGRVKHVRSAVSTMVAIGSLTSVAMGQAPSSYPPSQAAPPGQSTPPPPPPYGGQQPGSAQSSPEQPGSGAQPNYPAQPQGPQGYPPQQGYPPSSSPPGSQTQAQQPVYGQTQGYGGYNEPPLPPPPRRNELQWSIRFQLLNLLFGRVTGELEYAFWGPFSFAVVPEYVFADPSEDKARGITVSGGGVAGEFGYWVEGRPLRGYFLKAHGGYRTIKFKSDIAETNVPATRVGALFGSQSIYGGWFTLSGGLGVVYDFQSQDREFVTSGGRYVIGASGLFGNGFDLLGQLAIGGSF
jgi:hypothetical protein